MGLTLHLQNSHCSDDATDTLKTNVANNKAEEQKLALKAQKLRKQF